jgi:exodeoxyribonuclease VII small subunit
MESKRSRKESPRAPGETARAGAAPDAGAIDAVGLEEALARLDGIVRELETGTLDLDRSLALFEEGVALSRHAAKRLSEAEARITKLVRALDGEFRLEPFAVDGGESE